LPERHREAGVNNSIMVVDDERNILNSLFRVFKMEGYNVLMAESGKAGLELLRHNSVAVVISDYRMPDMDGVEFLNNVKGIAPDTVRFMLTGYADTKAVISAINTGEVYRFVTKPWDDGELKSAIHAAVERFNLVEENRRLAELTKRQNALLVEVNQGLEAKVEEKTKKIREGFFSFVGLYGDIIELHDRYIGGHSKRVASTTKGLASAMGMAAPDVDLVWAAALLHNIGLVGVPREVLDAEEDGLSESEKALFRNNPALSQEIVSKIGMLRQVGVVIRSHMEHFDGRGYPDGLKKEEIHPGARIISVCKAYDSLRHRRPAMPHSDALAKIESERGRMFDPAVVDAFIGYAADIKDDSTDDQASASSVVMPVGVAGLKPGMVLAKDLTTSKGRLLVTKGTEFSEALIEKVRNFNRIDPISGPVHVLIQPAC